MQTHKHACSVTFLLAVALTVGAGCGSAGTSTATNSSGNSSRLAGSTATRASYGQVNAVASGACVSPVAWWTTNSWPAAVTTKINATPLVLGTAPGVNTNYTVDQLKLLLATPAGNDSSLALAHQLIVANLNIAAVAYADLQIPAPNAFTYVPPQYVTDAINAANTWIGTRRLPLATASSSTITGWIAALESYNTAASDKDCQFVPTQTSWACADLGAAAGKNVVLLNGGFSGSSSDVGGSLFAKGNVSLTSYSVGSVLDPTTHPVTVVAGGTLTFTDGWITGDVWSSNKFAASPASLKSSADVTATFTDLSTVGDAKLVIAVTKDGGAPATTTVTFGPGTTSLAQVVTAINWHNVSTGVVASETNPGGASSLILTTVKAGSQQAIDISSTVAAIRTALNLTTTSATGTDGALVPTPASVKSDASMAADGTYNLSGYTLTATVTTDGTPVTNTVMFGANTTTLQKVIDAINAGVPGVVASANGQRLVITTKKIGSQQGIAIGFWGTANPTLEFAGTESSTGMDAGYVGGTGSTSTTSSPFDFGAASSTLTALSNYLLGFMDESAIATKQYDTLTLKNTSTSTFTVFTVPADLFSTVKAIDLEAPYADTVVINVTNTLNASPPGGAAPVTFPSSGTFNANGKTLLWNFPDASTLTISKVGVIGTVLAPVAAVTASNCQINGSVFAASFSGVDGIPTCQVNSVPFTACIPNSD